jgi:DNA-binding PadR family transcriptional regulator
MTSLNIESPWSGLEGSGRRFGSSRGRRAKGRDWLMQARGLESGPAAQEHHEHQEHRQRYESRGFGRHGFGPGGPGFGGFGPGFGPGPFGGGPFGFGRGGPRGRGGGRARRGDVRAAALILLGEQPRNGYQLIQELAARSGGSWKPSPGAVYPALQQLEDEGLIQAAGDEGRRVFELTPAGREYLDANREQFGTPWEQVGGELPDSIRELGDLGGQVRAALTQVAHAGTEEQIAKAATILTETRRALYLLLADAGGPSA